MAPCTPRPSPALRVRLRVTVREAIRVLAAPGLLTSVRGRVGGTFVTGADRAVDRVRLPDEAAGARDMPVTAR